MILFTMMLIPMLVALGFFLMGGKKFTVSEFLMQNIAQLIVMSMLLFFVGYSSTSDVEVWNGRVAKKYSEHVSCGHSYQCNCYTTCTSDSKGNQSCTQHCSTCYEHSYDVDWVVKTTNNESIEIDRVNRRGDREPPRFTAVQIGEPTAVAHSYTNYLKAAPDSLFRKQGLLEKYEKFIPKYPGAIYDYYRLNRMVFVNGATVGDVAQWNKDLEELNADLGRSKQVNAIIVVTKNMPDEFFYALEQKWIGSKKNDLVSVINIDDTGKITWTQIMALTSDKLAEVVVRDAINKVGSLDRTAIIGAIRSGIETSYHRKHMKDFEYLKDSTAPSGTFWAVSMILGLLISIGLGIFFLNNDFDDEDEGYQFFNKRGYSMSTLTKVLLGLVGTMVLAGVIAVSSIISINNQLVGLEAGLTAQYKQNQNNYDNMTKKVVEVAQVPSMATEDLEKLTKAAISGRYGSEGSKAVFQFIKEQNPTVNGELYGKIQQVIESGRNSFEADQKVLLDKKRIYETTLNSFPSGMVGRALGFPKIDLAKIDIVTSDRTEKAFDTKKDSAIELRKTK